MAQLISCLAKRKMGSAFMLNVAIRRRRRRRIVDVLEIGGRVVMRTLMYHGRLGSLG